MNVRVRVLCVDDYPDTANSVAEMLNLAGFEARACSSGPAALSVLGEFQPQACLLDLAMPDMDGVELANRIRAVFPLIRVIALTGQWDIDSRHRTTNAAFDAHLVKPISLPALEAVLRDR